MKLAEALIMRADLEVHIAQITSRMTENVLVQESVERIERCSFIMCNFMKNIFIPKSVTRIDPTAFDSPPSHTVHCCENNYPHSFAKEQNLRCVFVESSISEFKIEGNSLEAS
jgi:hypothetical protein